MAFTNGSIGETGACSIFVFTSTEPRAFSKQEEEAALIQF